MITRKDFDRPDHDKVGDTTARETFTSVGAALSNWERLEEMLAAIYAFLSSPAHSTHASFRAYGTLTATMSRRKMINAAAEVFFLNFSNELLSAKLISLLTLYGDAGGRRNEIAHGVVMGNAETKLVDNKYEIVRMHWFLMPAIHNTNKNTVIMEREYALNSETIDRFSKLFDQLTGEFITYISELRAFYHSLPEDRRKNY
ncbi:MAG: hypothetical protein HY242_03655 [Afipia sp.]|nr:hypothetical protein [Afipia sp.]